MPQMAPMMWFSLFMIFSTTMILFNQMMYFSFKNNKTTLMKKSMNILKKNNWKW
uniref:ATP synthase complex subunit 8 n=1 Tax=Algete brunneri TaxID=1634111 RepID=A0A516IMY0_9ORTH|nr:ATP synthase F0 subunit 8 [Algete brunneri]